MAIGGAVMLLALVTTPGPRAGAASIDIGAFNFRFAPNDLSGTVGDVVTFTNGGGVHTATAAGGGYPQISLGGGQSGSWTLAAQGTLWFYCSIHSNAGQANEQGLAGGAMVGRITVSQSAPTATPVPPTPTPPPPTATAPVPAVTQTPASATATPTLTSSTGTASATATGTAARSATATGTSQPGESTTPLPPAAADPPEDGGSGGPLMGFVAGGLALAAVGGGVFLALRLRRAT
jgi:plastocyanin